MDIIALDGQYGIAIKTVDETSGAISRRVLLPGSYVGADWAQTDISAESEDVKALAAKRWTAPVVDAYKALRAPPAPTVDDIVSERTRRLTAGFDYNFGDARGVHHIGTTDEDMKGWDEVTKASQAAIALSQPSTVINIVTNSGAVAVSALEWQQVLLAAAAARQPLWAKSFTLEAMSPIPRDFTSDSYWR
jgi:hypothetical protein